VIAPLLLLGTLVAASPSRDGAPSRHASAGAISHYLAARRAESEGDLPRAVEELRLALVFDEASAQIHAARASALLRLGRLDDADREARRTLELDPDGEAGADAHLIAGRIAALRRDGARARLAFRSAAALELAHARGRGPSERQGPDPEPWQALARLLRDAGDEAGETGTWEDLAPHLPVEAARGLREAARADLEAREPARAERRLRRATEIYPRDLEAWKQLAALVERGRRHAEARAAWEAALRADPEDLESLAALGRLSLRLGDAEGAQAYFRQLRHLDPDEAGAVAAAAMGLVEARRADEALRFLDGWRGPADPRVHYVRGLALEERRRWAEAAAAFSRIRPEDGELWVGARSNAAYALAHAGHGAEALRAVEEALAARPEEARLHTSRAWVLDRIGKSAEAARGLEAAIARREEAGDAEGISDLYEALAASLARAGRPAEGVAALRRALAARPRDEGLLFALGQAQERAGDMEAAIAQMRALLAVNPDHAEALNFVGYALAERGERLEEAERLLQRALELRPENGYFLDSLGWVYYQRGDMARAVATLERAAAAGDAEPTILEHLGDAYRKAGREADAAATWRRALRGIDAGESQDGPERVAAQRAAIERKLGELRGPGEGSRPSRSVDSP